MKILYKKIQKSKLFSELNINTTKELLSSYTLTPKTYDKNETIAIEGDFLDSVGIILDGTVQIQKLFPSGKVITIKDLGPGGIFGEAAVFCKLKTYPATLIAKKKTNIVYLNHTIITDLCQNRTFLENFMKLLSNKILMLNKKVELLSLESIRKKIAKFLLDKYQRTECTTIKIKKSRKDLAKLFNITRPSLSRELSGMADEGIIKISNKKIKILSIESLENILLN